MALSLQTWNGNLLMSALLKMKRMTNCWKVCLLGLSMLAIIVSSSRQYMHSLSLCICLSFLIGARFDVHQVHLQKQC